MNQKTTIQIKNKIQFESLGQDSPQIRASSPAQQQIEQLDLEQQKNSKNKIDRKHRKHKLKVKPTTLIKIKPVQRQQNQLEQGLQKVHDNFESLQQLSQQIKSQSKKYKPQANNKSSDNSTFQSPVLYRIDDSDQQESNCHANQQVIPQSSRRPLADIIKKDKKDSESDQLESPTKLLSTKNKNNSSNASSHTKIQGTSNSINKKSNIPERQRNRRKSRPIKLEVQSIKQQRQGTQIYHYQQNENKKSSGQSSEQYYDQNQPQEQQQLKFNRKLNETEKIEKQKQFLQKSIKKQAIFKSNSFYTLVNAQIPKQNYVNCIIKRKRFDDLLYEKLVVFECFLLEDKKYLITCIKDRFLKTTSHFQFYREKTDNHRENKYNKSNLYGYLDSNFTGTQFVFKSIQNKDTISEKSTAIDKSESMKMGDSMQAISQKNHKVNKMFPNQPNNGQQSSIYKDHVKQTCYMNFKTNFFGLAGQRQVKMLKKKNKKLKHTQNFSDLKIAQQNGQIDKYHTIQTKKAKPGKKGLELDFKGIAKMQSTKNIILENENSQNVLYFGKVKQDIYSISIGYPLSIMEGLAFSIANLDRKFFVN